MYTKKKIYYKAFSCLLYTLFFATYAQSHEFWIEPQNYTLSLQDTLVASLLNGEKFAGKNLAYNPHTFQRLQYTIDDNQPQNIHAKQNSKPAIRITTTQHGLLAISYQSVPYTVTYKSWDGFATFAKQKNFADIEARHQARKLPKQQFRESYVRFARSLIGIGSAQGNDSPSGMLTEIIALKNPYTDQLQGKLPIQLLYQQQPQPNTQIEIFAKTNQQPHKVHTAKIFTDSRGIASIPIQKNYQYLFNAVILREPSLEFSYQSAVAWETLWASLTLYIP